MSERYVLGPPLRCTCEHADHFPENQSPDQPRRHGYLEPLAVAMVDTEYGTYPHYQDCIDAGHGRVSPTDRYHVEMLAS